jgi:murein DD-endopeptidase MepM/ murein hydrolase activator NlpD
MKPASAPFVEPAKPAEVEQTASLSGPSADFRWPARGRVIAGFGSNGGNEGINIALPEGTPVKATEAGTVTYAGSEVKGYGNLVLIRHDNGYISAYAHNGELSVKRGERVKRGQVIAKSGQTGNVTSPQLHFEIRKGQTPVDPIAHLSGS